MTFIAKKLFKYEDTMFLVKLKDSKTNAKEVEVWNGHSHTTVPDPVVLDDKADPVFTQLPHPRGGTLPPIGKEDQSQPASLP